MQHGEGRTLPPRPFANTVGFNQLVSCSSNAVSRDHVLPLVKGLEALVLEKDTTGWKKLFLDGTTVDDFRFQRSFGSLACPDLKYYCAEIHREVQARLEKRYGSLYNISSGNILWSKPGGTNQAFHADFDPSVVNDLEHPPIVLFVCLSLQCRLDLYHYLEPMGAILKKQGDFHGQQMVYQCGLLEFHGGLPHCGCAYEEHNFRLHWYAWHKSKKLSPGCTLILFLIKIQ
jgi:hypothetical protein